MTPCLAGCKKYNADQKQHCKWLASYVSVTKDKMFIKLIQIEFMGYFYMKGCVTLLPF